MSRHTEKQIEQRKRPVKMFIQNTIDLKTERTLIAYFHANSNRGVIEQHAGSHLQSSTWVIRFVFCAQKNVKDSANAFVFSVDKRHYGVTWFRNKWMHFVAQNAFCLREKTCHTWWPISLLISGDADYIHPCGYLKLWPLHNYSDAPLRSVGTGPHS